MLLLEEIKRMGELMNVKSIERPDIDEEMDEIQRVTQYLNRDEGQHVKVNELVDIFNKSIETNLTDEVWSKLENTESNEIEKGEMDKALKVSEIYGKSSIKKLKNKFEDGSYKRPLILNFNDRYHLVAGNTRLCTAAAMGFTPKVFIGVLSMKDQMDNNDNSNK